MKHDLNLLSASRAMYLDQYHWNNSKPWTKNSAEYWNNSKPWTKNSAEYWNNSKSWTENSAEYWNNSI